MGGSRPSTFREVIGQEAACEQLKEIIEEAKKLGIPAPNISLVGPAGCGKTALAELAAWYLDAPLKSYTGDSVNNVDLMIAALRALDEGDVCFIDEFDGVYPKVRRQVLTTALTSGEVGVKGTGMIALKPFTLIVATTEGKMQANMASRFEKIVLEYYSVEDLTQIVVWSAEKTDKAHGGPFHVEREAARQLAARAMGVPREAQKLLGYAIRKKNLSGERDKVITMVHVAAGLKTNRVDERGLDADLRKILVAIAQNSVARPIGLKSIAGLLGAEDVSQEVNTLRRINLVMGTDRGQLATRAAYEHLWPGQPVPALVGR